jgi:Zn-dependent peptidase ImmA (M78 family)
MIRVTVSPLILRWAIDRAPEPMNIQMKFPKLSEWLDGASQPTLRQLEEFSKATSTPFGYFFLSEPPSERLPIPYFRTIHEETVRRPSPDLLEVAQTMEHRQGWIREYLIEQNYPPLSFVRSTKLSDDPNQVAAEMRHALGLNERWAANQPNWSAALRELQNRAEEAGIIVVSSSIVGNNPHRKLDPTEFRGFVLVDEYAPLVFVNSADGKAAQMFTLAHELAHVWLGSSAAFDLRHLQPADEAEERHCNQVAAEFLVPAFHLRQIWPSDSQEIEAIQIVARYFKVSEIVAARRALDLDLITRNEFFNFYENYRERERQATTRSGEGGNFYATQTVRLGKRFARTVIQAVLEGTLLYHEAYRLTGLYGQTFERFAAHLMESLQ